MKSAKTILSFICFFIFGFSLVLPFFDKNYLVEAPEPTLHPYDIITPPANSFGTSNMKVINWTYFRNLFQQHTNWILEYKRYSTDPWTNGNQYLTIDRQWNDSGYWKYDLILDVPVHVYSARFTFGIDVPCIKYVERSGYEVWLNYSVDDNETYSCMFNWSDLASIPNIVITHGQSNGLYWFRFQRDDIPPGHYVFDPWFGMLSGASTSELYSPNIRGAKGIPANNGYASSISATFVTGTWTSGEKVKAGLVDSSGNLLVETIERTSGGDGVQSFLFATPYYVSAGTTYYVCVFSDTTRVTVYYNSATNSRVQDGSASYPNWNSPLTIASGVQFAFYCTYTNYSAPDVSVSGVNPANAATSVGIVPITAATLINMSGGDLDATMWSNSSGSWAQYASFSSITNNTQVSFLNTNFSDMLTKYWWSINVSSGAEWYNDTYYFTTQNNFTGIWDVDLDDGYLFGSAVQTIIVDVNHNGYPWLYQTASNTTFGGGKIFCMNASTGERIWNRTIPTAIGGSNPMAAGDLLNDGDWEVVVAAGTRTICYYCSNGTTLWNISTPGGWSAPAVADVDDSGYPYIYIASNTGVEPGQAHIRKLYGNNGTTAAIANIDYSCWGGVSIADLDRDGEFEVFVTDSDEDWCFDEDLNLLWYTTDYTSESHCAILDNITGDGNLEVVVGNQSMSGAIDGVYVYYANGTVVPGKDDGNLLMKFHIQPTVYDVDYDGHKEILTAFGSYPNVFDLVSWTLDGNITAEISSEPPGVANVLGDDRMEIIGYSAWDDDYADIYNGTTLSQIAHLPSGGYYGRCIVSDVDNDGYVELIGYGNGYLWGVDCTVTIPDPAPRTDTNFYSERRTQAAEYIPLIGGKCVLTNPDPADATVSLRNTSGTLSIDINEPNGDAIEWSIETVPDVGSNYGTDEVNGTKTCSITGLQPGTTYTWWVNATDQTNWIRQSYTFITADWTQIESGYFTFGNTSEFTQIESGYFTFGNTSEFTQIESGYFTFGNTSAYNQLLSGWFTFSNSTILEFKNITSGYFTFGNTSSYEQITSGYFTFGNTSEFTQLESGYFTFGNTSSIKQIVSGWFTFGNDAEYTQFTSGWFTFGNTSTYNQLESGWFNFGNTSSEKQLLSGWFNFGNSSSFSQIVSGWFTFESGAEYTQFTSGYFTFGNTSSMKQLTSGYFTFGNTSSMSQILSGWFTFANGATFTQFRSGYFTFGNTSSHNQLESGYFIFRNTSDYTQLFSGWFTFGNGANYTQFTSGYFTFGNTSTYTDIDTGYFTFGNESENTQLLSGWFTFGNTSMYTQLLSGWFTFNATQGWGQVARGYFTFGNGSVFTDIDHGWFTFRNSSPVACFTYEIVGSSIYCTSCSLYADAYRWSVLINETSSGGTTGWITDGSGTEYVYTIPWSGVIKIILDVQTGVFTDTQAMSLGYIDIDQDYYDPEYYTQRAGCEAAGYYWYQDDDGIYRCHKHPETLPWNEDDDDLPEAGYPTFPKLKIGYFTIDITTLLIFIVTILVFVYLYTKKKEKKGGTQGGDNH